MNVAQMLLMLQYQQMDNAWQNALNNENGTVETGGIGSSNSNPQLFAALLQAALGGGGAASSSVSASPELTSTGNELPNTTSVQDADNNKLASVSQMDCGNGNSINNVINSVAQKYGVNPALIQQVVQAESGFDSKATSGAGAMGLMQLMPGTAASYGVQNAYDVAQNLDGGTHFLKDLLDRFQGSVPLSLAAYNAGPGAVEKYQGVPPYKETQAYVQKIMAGLNQKDWEA